MATKEAALWGGAIAVARDVVTSEDKVLDVVRAGMAPENVVPVAAPGATNCCFAARAPRYSSTTRHRSPVNFLAGLLIRHPREDGLPEGIL